MKSIKRSSKTKKSKVIQNPDRFEGEIKIIDKKISMVNFPKGKSQTIYTEKYSVLHNSLPWQPNEGLSIITGINGVGKSHLLNFIRMKIAKVFDRDRKEDPSKSKIIEFDSGTLLFVPGEFQPLADINNVQDQKNLFLEDLDNETQQKEIIKHINRYHASPEELTSDIAQLKLLGQATSVSIDVPKLLFRISVAQKIISQPNYAKLTDIQKIEQARKIVLDMPPDIAYSGANYVMSSFLNVFRAYRDLKDRIVKIECTTENLLESILANKDNDFVTSKEEMRSIFSDEYKAKYVEFRLNERWGSNIKPWDEVAQQMSTLPFFKHILFYQEEQDKIYFVDRKDSPNYGASFDSLSSGEKMILTILSWQYIYRGHSTEANGINQRSNYKHDIILLDEPDRHFDPKLCKVFYKVVSDILVKELGIQVIMTTHRIDTISLAQDNEIFTICRDGDAIREVTPCHRLLAMFRLTSNLREFTNHHHVVYTESRTDALFYEGVYKSLMGICNTMRESFSIARWQQVEIPEFSYLLSRRSQLSFRSVSDNADGGGNCAKVIDYVAKDITAYRNFKRTDSFYSSTELYSPYGIVDNDYGKQYSFEKIYKAENHEQINLVQNERIFILQRHSVENFICDPFVLCAAIESGILNKIDDFKSKGEIIKPLKGSFLRILENLLTAITNNGITAIQENVELYFKLLFSMLYYRKYALESIIKPKRDPEIQKKEEIHHKLMHKIDRLFKQGGEKVTICDKAIAVIIGNNILTVNYPEEFIDLRGHNIAETLFGEDKAKDISREIAEKIYYEGIPYIPLDLAQTIFSLNYHLVQHVRHILKPNTIKETWLEKVQGNDVGQDIGASESKEDQVVDESITAVPDAQQTELSELTRNIIANQDIGVNYLNNIVYDSANLMLYQDELLYRAGQIGGIEVIDKLIALGEDKDVSFNIIEAVRTYGANHVLSILFTHYAPENRLVIEPEIYEKPHFRTESHNNLLLSAFAAKEVIEALPLIKYLIKEIFHINLSWPEQLDNKYFKIGLHYVACNVGKYVIDGRLDVGGSMLSTNIYTIKILSYEYLAHQKQINFQNHENKSINTPIDFVEKCGADIATQAIIGSIGSGLSGTPVLYDVIISASIAGMQCYNIYKQTPKASQVTATEFIAPYIVDLLTLYTITKNVKFDLITSADQMMAIKQGIAIISSIVTVDYISKIIINEIYNDAVYYINNLVGMAYDYFNKDCNHEL